MMKPSALCFCASVACLSLVAGAWTPSAAQQLLDKVVARVAGVPITQSHVEGALGLGVVEPEPGEDRLASATRKVIDRQLLLGEVARFPPSDPADGAVEALVARMKAHAGSGYEALLRRTGLDEARVRELARDTLRIQAYVDQRFGTTAQASLQEAREYYDANRQQFARNGAIAPFDEVEADARAAAAAQRRRATIARWLDDLRTRADVVDLTARP